MNSSWALEERGIDKTHLSVITRPRDSADILIYLAQQ